MQADRVSVECVDQLAHRNSAASGQSDPAGTNTAAQLRPTPSSAAAGPAPQAPRPVLRLALQGRVRRGVCERTPFLLGCAVRSSSAAEACPRWIHPSRSSRVVCPGVLHGHLAARAPSVAASSAGSASVQGDLVIRRGYDRARAQRAGGAALRGPAHRGRGMTKLSVY